MTLVICHAIALIMKSLSLVSYSNGRYGCCFDVTLATRAPLSSMYIVRKQSVLTLFEERNESSISTVTQCGHLKIHGENLKSHFSPITRFDMFCGIHTPNTTLEMAIHYELPMEKKVPWNGAVSMRSRAGSWETLSICITLRHNQGAPADMHANALGILIICRFPLA